MDIHALVESQHRYYQSGATRPVEFRIEALRKLQRAIRANEKLLADALKQDLNKSETESYMCETGMVLEELSYHIKHVAKWAKERRVKTPLAQFPAKSFISPEPYGVALIMAPWNYPFMLLMEPLIGALAAVIPAEYEPEALKAQAVILRSSCVAGGHLEETVLENGITGAAQESISQNSVSAFEPRIIDSNSGFSYLDKAQRKRLWGEQADVLEERCREAVRASSGYVLEWQGAAVSAPFFRLSAGRTRSGTELFGQESDWCKSIACPVDEAAEDFLQEKSMKTERFFGMLEAEGVSVEKDAPKLVLTRDSAGYVLNVRAGRSSIEGERFRQLFELPSSCFFLEEQGGKMVITTKGIGHGIGLDQYYANALAKQGASAEEILELFFPGLLKKSE